MHTVATSISKGEPEPLLVDSAKAARMLGISSRTLFSLQASGHLRPTRIGRSVRFSIAELQRFVAANEAACSTQKNRK